MNRLLSALALLAVAACGQSKSSPDELVERGEYLVTIGGCNDCHMPWKFDPGLKMPVPDMSRRLSGHPAGAPDPEGTVGQHDMGLIGPTFTAFKLPFGTIHARNLTPHATGLGNWSEAQFIQSMRTGRSMGVGRPLLPPMPWPSVAALTDADLRAMFAYLQSLPPIANSVESPSVPDAVIDGIAESNAKIAMAAAERAAAR